MTKVLSRLLPLLCKARYTDALCNADETEFWILSLWESSDIALRFCVSHSFHCSGKEARVCLVSLFEGVVLTI